MNIDELVGKRCLVKMSGVQGFRNSTIIEEIKVVELSPSGAWVKIMNLYGKKYWRAVADISLAEVLIDLKAGKPQ